jgi:hypothetical protein
MVELYQDTLIDLLLPKTAKRMKLEVKKDSKVSPFINQYLMELIFLALKGYMNPWLSLHQIMLEHWYSSVYSIFFHCLVIG